MSAPAPSLPAAQPAGPSQRWRQALYVLAVTLTLGTWLTLALTHLGFFSLEDDEGTLLVTAQAVWQGHALYREVWFNYFSGLMHLLQLAFWAGGVSIASPRVLIVIVTALTILAAAGVARQVAGRTAGFLTVLLLTLAPATSRMGRSVMAEGPAALCGALAILLLLQHLRAGRLRWLALSGLAAGLGIWFKYPTAILLIILLVGLWAAAWRQRLGFKTVAARSALLVSLAVAPVLLSTLAYDLPAQWEQIVGTYLRSNDYDDLNVVRNLGKYYGYLQLNNWGLVALATMGLATLGKRQRHFAWLLGAWLGVYGLTMLFSTPLGTHHMYLFLAPLVILAAIGLASLPGLLRAARRSTLPRAQRLELVGAIVTSLVYLALLPGSLRHTADYYRGDKAENQALYEAVALLQAHTLPGDYVVSDLGMITFRAGRTAPPPLTNTSGMRFQTASLTDAMVQAISDTYRPAAVVFWEEKFTDHAPGFVAEVQTDYVELYRQYEEQDESYLRLHGLYLRPDRAK